MTTRECAHCGAVAPIPPGARLPAGWEHYRPGDHDTPAWCSSCVSALIGDALDLMARIGAPDRDRHDDEGDDDHDDEP